MKNTEHLLFLLILHPFSAIGQESYKSDSAMIANYLSDPKLPGIVNEYYYKKFTASDDSMSFNLLDTLTSRNDHFFPFYFSIFNGIVIHSDFALAEAMGGYCFN